MDYGVDVKNTHSWEDEAMTAEGQAQLRVKVE